MSNKFTNNVRTRLYKQGYQGFTKDDYTEAALAVECDDLDNPTKEQLNLAVEYLKAKATSGLAAQNCRVGQAGGAGEEVQQGEKELFFNNAFSSPASPASPACHHAESSLHTTRLSVADEPVEEKFLTQVEAETEVETGALTVAPQDVGEMITNKASQMGVILSQQQINDIADSVDTSANTFDEILEQVETALLAYADFSANQVDAKIDQTLTLVKERVVNRHEQSRDKLSRGLTGISAALEDSRNQTKSQLQGILARLNTV